ncbi:MAG: hypothetical protein U0871_14155 [Gemmataceae bacterium]
MRRRRASQSVGTALRLTPLVAAAGVAYRPNMTEADWLTSDTLSLSMFRRVEGDLSPRKLQLIACAACRLVWPMFDGQTLVETVEAVERHADGQLSDADYLATRDQFLRRYQPFENWQFEEAYVAGYGPEAVVAALVSENVRAGCDRVINWVPWQAGWFSRGREERRGAYRGRICGLIREIVGNPFRPWKPVPAFLGGGLIQPDGRTVPVSSAARGLAEGIAADLGFDRLPILADALEEGGVTDAELLAHCRRPGGHVRGCWAVDVVLGRSS